MNVRCAARRLVAATLLGPLVILVSCSGPARTDASFSSKAASTADQARSSVETVVVLVESADRHHLPEPYLSTAIAEAEDDAGAALTGFESVQPPSSRSDLVRSRTSEVVGDAVDLLAQARISARRGHAPVELLPELRRASVRLDSLAANVER
ncbi:MAG TPA: hypothetical protein VNS19_09470 [Acidimicrobiales bacterium]|nr:hypothetical protein [Acidimicrobiales bacterium]